MISQLSRDDYPIKAVTIGQLAAEQWSLVPQVAMLRCGWSKSLVLN